MDERQSRWLVALSALLAFFVLGILYLEPPPADPGEGRRWTRIAGDRSIATAAELEVRVSGQIVRMERVEGVWRWVEPLEVNGDGARVDALLQSLLDVELGDVIAVRPEEVGIDSEAVDLQVRFQDASSLELTVGDDAAVGSSTYVRDASGSVRATRTRLTTALPNSIDDLRTRAIASFPRSEVQRIGLGARGDQQPVAFERRGDHWWFADRLPALRASETRIHTLMDAVRYAEAEAFPDGVAELSPGAWTVSVEHGEPARTTELRLARSLDGSWLVSGPEQPSPVPLASSDLVALLESGDEGWLETRVLILRPTRLQRLEVQLDGDSVVADRTADGWGHPAAEALLVAIEAGRAERGAGLPKPEGASTGLLRATHDAGTVSVELFQTLQNGDRVATEDGTEAPFRVTAGTIEALQQALSAGG